MTSSSPLFEDLVRGLSDPKAFPSAPGDVRCVRTHISVVFLAGSRAYKIKRPRDLGFLDFTTLEARRHYCHEEVRLNRRLAPGVYEGVVAVLSGSAARDGDPRFSGELVGPDDPAPAGVLEWAVRMVRLPDDRALGALLADERVGLEDLRRLADRLVDFHTSARNGSDISAAARWEAVRGVARENLGQIERFVGRTLSSRVIERLRELCERELERNRGLIERRAERGVPREIHGDLRLEHVYFLPSGSPGGSDREPSGLADRTREDEIVIVDCVEFNERFRWADPVADIAFLVMELEFADRPDLATTFAERYFLSSNDLEGASLLPYYATYRDVVRGKVRSFQAEDLALGETACAKAARKATRHFLRAVSRLAEPGERPALVVIQGLPGVGKSSVARGLVDAGGFQWVDTDRVRKELASASLTEVANEGVYGGGFYTEEWNERTYRECERRATECLLEGCRVVVEGSFRREPHRASFLDLADRLGVPAVLLHCRLDADEARRRLASREKGASDADWKIREEMSRDWDHPSRRTASRTRELSVEGSLTDAVGRAVAILETEGLA